MRQLSSQLLAGETNKVGAGNHGNVREGEDEDVTVFECV